jgi:hypothetical protein
MQFGRGGKPAAGAFYDSDFATMDEVLAISLLHGLQGKNDCRVAIVTMSRPNLAVAGYLDALERFYRGPAAVFAQVPPIGMPTKGEAGETSKAFTAPFEVKDADGKPVYHNQVKRALETGDPLTLFRNYLQAQNDLNAFFVLAGPATNLAAAMEFRGMRDLLTSKLKYLVVSGGNSFGSDGAAAKAVLKDWPTPLVFAGPELGSALPFPGASITKEFPAQVPNHLAAEAYKSFRPMPYDTPSWAMAAALHAARPNAGYFKVSEPGTLTMQADGRTTFQPSADGRHRHLILDPSQKDKILQDYVELASAKPAVQQRFRPPVADKAADKAADKPAEKP